MGRAGAGSLQAAARGAPWDPAKGWGAHRAGCQPHGAGSPWLALCPRLLPSAWVPRATSLQGGGMASAGNCPPPTAAALCCPGRSPGPSQDPQIPLPQCAARGRSEPLLLCFRLTQKTKRQKSGSHRNQKSAVCPSNCNPARAGPGWVSSCRGQERSEAPAGVEMSPLLRGCHRTPEPCCTPGMGSRSQRAAGSSRGGKGGVGRLWGCSEGNRGKPVTKFISGVDGTKLRGTGEGTDGAAVSHPLVLSPNPDIRH